MANFWMKLYVEILDDPKVGRIGGIMSMAIKSQVCDRAEYQETQAVFSLAVVLPSW